MPYLPFFIAQVRTDATTEFIDSLARTPLSQVLLFVAALSAIRLALYPYLKSVKPHLRDGAFGFARLINEFLDALIYAAVFVFMIIRPFGIQAFKIPSGSMWPTLYVNDFIVANKAIYRFSDPKHGDIVVFRPPAIAVFPRDPNASGEVNVDFIKRCIGVPGDLIELKEGILYRNGQRVDETNRHLSDCMDPDRANCVNFRELTPEEKKDTTLANFKLVKRDGQIIPFNWTEFDGNAAMAQTRSWSDHSIPYQVTAKFILEPDEANRLKSAPAERIPAGYYLMMGDNRNNSFDGRSWGLIPRESIIGRSEFIWLPIPRMNITR